MTAAYVDTSCLVAVAFGESGARAMSRRLTGFEALVASNLLEAELRSVFLREKVAFPRSLLDGVSWLIPDRPLHDEIERVLEAGYTRGADCWHVASALYLAPQPDQLTFLTLDDRQRTVARALGFAT